MWPLGLLLSRLSVYLNTIERWHDYNYNGFEKPESDEFTYLKNYILNTLDSRNEMIYVNIRIQNIWLISFLMYFVVAVFNRNARKMFVEFCLHTEHTRYVNIVIYVMRPYFDMALK